MCYGGRSESECWEAQGSEVIMSGVIRASNRLSKAYIIVLMMVRRNTGESLCVCKSVFSCVTNLSNYCKVKGKVERCEKCERDDHATYLTAFHPNHRTDVMRSV